MNNNTTIHPALKIAMDFIKIREGFSLKAYKCSANVWTIGYGNTSYLKQFSNPAPVTINPQKANELFYSDVRIFFDAVLKEVGLICNNNQIAALTSFAFNFGVKAFRESTLLKVIKINPNNLEEIERQFMRWINAGGQPVEGLINRRRFEFELYKKAL